MFQSMENPIVSCKDMSKSKNATKVNIKPNEKQQKHSSVFYISPSLFDNKRLKQKREKWAAACQLARANYHSSFGGRVASNAAATKTLWNCRKSMLEPAITIDLLSDDEEEELKHNPQHQPTTPVNNKNVQYNNNGKQTATPSPQPPPLVMQSEPPPLAPLQGVLPQHFLLYPASHLQLGGSLHPANIRLIPMSQLNSKTPPQLCLDPATLSQLNSKMQLQLDPATLAKLTGQQQAGAFDAPSRVIAQSKLMLDTTVPIVNNGKRKRKSRLPKRHSQPLVVTTSESIVLTDDSDSEVAITTSPVQMPPLVATRATPQPPPPMPNGNSDGVSKSKNSPLADSREPSPVRIAQVDEEVTVSLVPRSATGRCSGGGGSSKAASNSKLFPMLPDETTVHTVIANRTYELSLTKLREGLGIDGEPAAAQQKVSPTRRKGTSAAAQAQTAAAGGAAELPAEGPISLKLSSDLSISLISDEEDDAAVAESVAEKLLQLPPQLAVQEVRMPATLSPDGRQVPRRRKLG